jgi:hypothetical protein
MTSACLGPAAPPCRAADAVARIAGRRWAWLLLTLAPLTVGNGCGGGPVQSTDAAARSGGAGATGGSATGGGSAGSATHGTDAAGRGDATAGSPFTFLVFGDMNGGACERNQYVGRLVTRMAAEPNVDFFVSTGDLIDGWTESQGTLCFAGNPSGACSGGEPTGNVAALLAPLKSRPPVAGLVSSLFLTIGNHDDNWGSDWYPDPCGGGICGLLAPLTPDALLNHPHGDVCSLDPDASAFGTDFYYSFSHAGSTFIVLRQNDDEEGMLACNHHSDCPSYCSDPANFADPRRADDCYEVAQFDWLRGQLAAASASARHIFVFVHAVMLGSGDNHGPNAAAPQLRALFEQANVGLVVTGHNHAYERTHAVRGNAIDATGTTYITVGTAGALTDGVTGDWFTAATYERWTDDYGDLAANTGYLRVTVNGDTVLVERMSLAAGAAPVDRVTITR